MRYITFAAVPAVLFLRPFSGFPDYYVVSNLFASSIIQEAALSFLGAGVPAGDPSWGSILSDGKNYIYNSWWLIVFPGIFTIVSVLGFNLFGDGLRDFFDPTKT